MTGPIIPAAPPIPSSYPPEVATHGNPWVIVAFFVLVTLIGFIAYLIDRKKKEQEEKK